MKLSRHRPRTKYSRSVAVSMIGLSALVLLLALTLGGGASAASVTAVPLGSAGNFALLASTGIHDVPTSAISGDVGVGVAGGGGSITGLTCAEVNGNIYSPDAAGPPCRLTRPGLLTNAQNNLTAAYINAQHRTPTSSVGQLGGQILVPGVYTLPHATTANLIGNVTLTGDASSVWIFQATTDFVTAGSSTVTLTGGAQACNVFWQVGTAAILGGSSNLKGTVLAGTSITVNAGATISGRLLAEALITLNTDTVNRSDCATSGGSTPAPAPGPAPDREIYCDPSGKAYDLVVGQDQTPPYNQLGLVPAYVDPITGAKSCNFPAAATTTTPATTTTATPPPVVVTPTPVTVTPTPVAKPVKKSGVAATKVTKVKAAKPKPAAHTPPRAARHHVGLTG